jgi:hypothetical protein
VPAVAATGVEEDGLAAQTIGDACCSDDVAAIALSVSEANLDDVNDDACRGDRMGLGGAESDSPSRLLLLSEPRLPVDLPDIISSTGSTLHTNLISLKKFDSLNLAIASPIDEFVSASAHNASARVTGSLCPC